MGSTYGYAKESSNMESDSTAIDKTRMSVQARSAGDGMENVPQMEAISSSIGSFSKSLNTSDSRSVSNNFVPSSGKRKEPKFVPYEPYKAAVSPIIPNLSKKDKAHFAKVVIDPSLIKPLASKIIEESSLPSVQVSDKARESISSLASTFELTKCNSSPDLVNDIESSTWHDEKNVLENKIKELTKEKQDLETQFNIQTKVNTDLKKLLVASLGEDMQTKVQYMSEDKAKLGEHVLFYSHKLSENNEEREKLSVQCDIWKSKFEASSLLVEDLACCKVVLSRKFGEANEALQLLLKEHEKMHKELMSTFRTLLQVQEAFDPSPKWNPTSSQCSWNLSQLASATHKLSTDVQSRLLGNSTISSNIADKLKDVPCLTTAEVLAHKVISSTEVLSTLMQHEANRRNEKRPGTLASQVLPHICPKEPTMNCCNHCSGEILLV